MAKIAVDVDRDVGSPLEGEIIETAARATVAHVDRISVDKHTGHRARSCARVVRAAIVDDDDFVVWSRQGYTPADLTDEVAALICRHEDTEFHARRVISTMSGFVAQGPRREACAIVGARCPSMPEPSTRGYGTAKRQYSHDERSGWAFALLGEPCGRP